MRALRFGVVLGVALALLLGADVLAFKQSDFKLCSQATFCHRMRTELKEKEVKPLWTIMVDERRDVPGGATFSMVDNSNPGDKLELTVVALRDRTWRVRVTEPGRSRYEVEDVLLPVTASNTVTRERGEAQFVLDDHVAKTKAVIHFFPFSVEFLDDEEVSVALNQEQLFHVECKRELEDGQSWEESFNNHKDTRKNGPEGLSFDATFFGASGVFGLPERALPLQLPSTKEGTEIRTEPYRLYNLDVFEYEHNHPFGLYGSIPFMVAHGKKRSTGLFWLNASEMWVDVENAEGRVSTQWISESGIIDVFVVMGPKPADVFRQYGRLTGNTYLPPLFSLGYHQCRWNYRDEADVAAVDAGFEEHEMPYDVIWLDIEHTDGKKYFTWDKHSFPTPIEMQNKIAAKRRKMVTIIDPHIKRDDNYYIYSEALSNDFFVKNRDGGVYDGHCWPGGSSYLDFTSKRVRDWWASQYKYDNYKGSTENLYTWNDMNEPSVFNGPEITMQKDNLHNDGKIEHRDIHNIYGYLYHMASAQGHLERSDKKLRPFILSRAFFAGTQRYGPIWTGDNMANWDHLRVSYPMIMSVSVAGLPFVGADVGGFFGEPDAELATRWYQAGVFYPFFRGHAHLETKRREPWLFGDPYTGHIRDALRARYQLLPYLYTLFFQSHRTGMPVARPLWVEFPEDEETYGIDEQMMLGNAIMSKVIAQPGATETEVYLPQGASWYQLDMSDSLHSKAHLEPGKHTISCPLEGGIPVFQRSGTIVVRKERPRRSSGTMDMDPYTLYIATDSNGSAHGSLFVDDGITTNAEYHNQYLQVEMSYANGGLRVKPSIPFHTDELVEKFNHLWVERVVVMSPKGSQVIRRPSIELIHEATFKIGA